MTEPLEEVREVKTVKLGEGEYVVVPDDHDTFVPAEYVGNPIAPNHYCRGWNPKEGRQKYCRARAGANTDHTGFGRCSFHGGNSGVVTHGLRRRYVFKTPRLQQLLDILDDDPNPGSIDDEIKLLRARLQLYLEEHTGDETPDIDILSRLVSEITKTVERDSNMRSRNAITYDQLRRFLFATERVIQGRIRTVIKDPTEADAFLEKLGEELRGIRP